jgi:hypothetical protein
MAVLGVAAALVVAVCVGYVLGYRRGSRTPTWRQRTSRAALGRQALGLVALVAAGELQRGARRRLWIVGR